MEVEGDSNEPPNIVDTETRCQYEKKHDERTREYQPVMQKVSERANVKLYIRNNLKKETNLKEKYHRHVCRQIQSKSFQKKIKLQDFVNPDSIKFGIKKTPLESEHIIPNSSLHLDFYP